MVPALLHVRLSIQSVSPFLSKRRFRLTVPMPRQILRLLCPSSHTAPHITTEPLLAQARLADHAALLHLGIKLTHVRRFRWPDLHPATPHPPHRITCQPQWVPPRSAEADALDGLPHHSLTLYLYHGCFAFDCMCLTTTGIARRTTRRIMR